MIKNFFRISFILFALFSSSVFGQIKVKEAGITFSLDAAPDFFDITQTRKVIQLNKDWEVYPEDEPGKAISITTPASFEGLDALEFKTTFELTEKQLLNSNIELHFLRLNYSADIFLNEVVITKHTGGNYPFSISLPKDILKFGTSNILRIRVRHKLGSDNTIPVAQRFLFPQNYGGILDQVYLHLTPVNGIEHISTIESLSKNRNTAQLKISFEINKKHAVKNNSLNNLRVKRFVNISLTDNNGNVVKSIPNYPVKFEKNSSVFYGKNQIEFTKPKLWQSDNPIFYSLKIDYYNDNVLIDETIKQINFVDIKHTSKGLFINGKPFTIKGTTYYFSYGENGGLIDYNRLTTDLTTIKKAGFNTVRFAKELPSPFAINICSQLGLFVQIELPVNSVPKQILNSKSFIERAKELASAMINAYGNFPNVLSFGLGSSFLPDEESDLNFLKEIGGYIKSKSNEITYASFLRFPKSRIDNVDLYGIELLAAEPESESSLFMSASQSLGKRNIFISEATYPTYKGNTNGYLNKFSFEGQAKYFENVINFSQSSHIAGFIINSMFDYRGDFNSFFTGYTPNNLYRIGILGESGKTDRISFNLIESKLLNKEKITIPIGTKKDSSPFLFIIISVILSIIMALLINSKRKFREDTTRALIRSYNFFADIRDLRILSGLHTTILMFTLSGVFSLLLTILLTYLQNNILLEKILLSFNSEWFLTSVSFLAWHPLQSFFYLFAFSVGLIFIQTAILKLFSLFLKTRVLTTNIFFTVVWALLPLALMLPFELVLHRLLLTEIGNIFIYVFILIYLMWLVQRILKGVYVIFDIRLATVYFYSFTLFILVFGIVIIYFQLSDSTIYYIISSFKQYRFM